MSESVLPRTALRPAPLPQTSSRLMGLGAAQPAVSTAGEQLGTAFGRSADWIETRTGIRSLRRLSSSESILDMAVDAAAQALVGAGVEARDVDLVIACTCSVESEDRGGGLHSHVIDRLTPRAAGFQLNSACSGFCYALATADGLIRTGDARHVLIVAAESMSTIIDPTDLGTSIIFGDGAGAAVVGSSAASDWVAPPVWGSDGGQSELISFFDGDPFMRMQGQAVFRWAVAAMATVAEEACRRAGIAAADIEVFVPHQANLRIVKALAEKMNLSESVLIAEDIAISGNTSAASIPIALTRLSEQGRTRTGQLALLLGFGAGLAWAAQVVRLP